MAHSDDRRAFAELVRRHQGAVRLFVQRLCGGDHMLADEIAQDAFVIAHRERGRFRPEGSYRTWLLGIARNVQRNAVRKERRPPMAPLENVAAETESPAARARLSSLEEALLQLSAEQRAAVHLHYQEQMPLAEISLVLSLPEGTVKSHLHRAKQRLRELLAPAHESA